MEIGSSWSFLLLAVRLVTKMPEAETALELLAKTGLKYRGLAREKGWGLGATLGLRALPL